MCTFCILLHCTVSTRYFLLQDPKKFCRVNRRGSLLFAILIPAYQPDHTLVELAEALLPAAKAEPGFGGFVVVDDGSTNISASDTFARLGQMDSVTVVAHETNQGKGAALKTGFTQCRQRVRDLDFVVTADADGQHEPADILNVCRIAREKRHPVIGTREFGEHVPFRNRFGNILTRMLFRAISGVKVNDTQSGLRAYPAEDIPAMLEISENRYEFEFGALFTLARKWKRRILQPTIKTVYEPGNPTSHFNPIVDSLKIYAIFLRYISVSALVSVGDILLFSLLAAVGVKTLPALIASRIVTAPFYFFGMKRFAFRSGGNPVLQATGLAMLMAFHVTFLWVFIDWFAGATNAPRGLAMIIGVLLFYIGNFLAQRYLIFRPAGSEPTA